MQARCRKSLVWIGLLVILVGWAGVGSTAAKAADAPDLSWLQDDSCAEGVSVAEFDAPDWLQAAPAAPDKPSYKGGCTANGQCHNKKEYCAKAAGDCKGKGECKARPEICTEIFKPVCGCNHKTYSNECFAAAAGVNVASEGACKTDGATAAKACKTNAQCPKGDYCAKDTGKCDEEGVCAQKPMICPLVVAPVCGCDGKTYNNNCMAHRAGVNVKHDGKC
jgi:Kazal-type serine protease inhibitor-like protein